MGAGNGDAVVDQEDYALWRANYGSGGVGGAAVAQATPEPAAAILTLLAVGSFSLTRHRRGRGL